MALNYNSENPSNSEIEKLKVMAGSLNKGASVGGSMNGGLGYISTPCPSCGYCPTCGRNNQKAYYTSGPTCKSLGAF